MTQRLRSISFGLAVLLSCFILFRPGGAGPLPFDHADKVIHIATFALLAVTAWWRFRSRQRIAVYLLIYAVGSELIQHFFVPGRSFDAMDIAADAVGIFAILLAVRSRQ